MCFFLTVETYMKYYQQAAKSHKAITFQDSSQGGTAPGGISPFSEFMHLLSCCFNKYKMIILVSVCKRKGRFRNSAVILVDTSPAGPDTGPWALPAGKRAVALKMVLFESNDQAWPVLS